MKAKINPSYVENDRLIELAELERYKKALEWLGDPKNKFSYSVQTDGQISVGTRYHFTLYPDMLTAVEAQQRA